MLNIETIVDEKEAPTSSIREQCRNKANYVVLLFSLKGVKGNEKNRTNLTGTDFDPLACRVRRELRDSVKHTVDPKRSIHAGTEYASSEHTRRAS